MRINCDKVVECRANQANRTVRPSVPVRVLCISPIFFEVGNQNLVCGCILGWRSVEYHFRVTVTLTLTSDLVYRKNRVRSISLILFEVGISNLVCGCSGMTKCRIP